MLYFNKARIDFPNNEDLQQLRALLKFKNSLPKEGFWWEYNGVSDFKIKVSTHIKNYLEYKYDTKKSILPTVQKSNKLSDQAIENIFKIYKDGLKKNISKIRLLGDNTEYDLTNVFVDLRITKQYERPEWKPKKHFPFDDFFYTYKQELFDQSAYESTKIEPKELLKFNTKTIIVGSPGSGKSSLLRYLTLQTLKKKDIIPIYLELKNIQKSDFRGSDRFIDIVFNEALISQLYLNNEDTQTIKEILNKKLTEKKIAFFLDGLDEVKETSLASVSLRDLFNKFIQAEYIRDNLVIVTTRPYALQAKYYSHQVNEMEILPLKTREIEQFVNHYYGNHPAGLNFLADLKSYSAFHVLARTPLILGFLLQMYIKNNTFSKNRLEVYEKIVNNLSVEWDNEKGIDRHSQIEYSSTIRIREFLSKFAFSRLLNFNSVVTNRFVFSSQELLVEAEKYCKGKSYINPDKFTELIKTNALLREVGKDRYSFTHTIIQEYLAANILNNDENIKKIFCQAYFDPIVCEMEVLPITMGLIQDNKLQEIFEMLENLPESLNFANFRLRLRSLSYTTKLLNDNLFSRLIIKLLEIVMGKNIDESCYVDKVFESLSGISEENRLYISEYFLEPIRRRATKSLNFIPIIFALTELNAKEAIPELLKLLKDEDITVRYISAFGLGLLQSKEAIPELLNLLEGTDNKVRSASAVALGLLKSKKAIHQLLKLLKEGDNFVRTSCIFALSALNAKEAIPELLNLLKDTDSKVRSASANSLGLLQSKEAIPELLNLLKDKDSDVRKASADALERYNNILIVEGLFLSLTKGHFIRKKSISCLGYYASENCKEKLNIAINDQDIEIKALARQELEKLQNKLNILAT